MTDGVASAIGQSAAAAATQAGTSPRPETINQAQFLQLFVAQLQHQDPLSPLEPDQLTAQLAQFASLEQLTGINTRLDKLGTTSGQSTGSGLLPLLGRQVTFDGSRLALKDGKAAPVSFTLDGPADKVTASVRTAGGTAVRTVELGAQGAGPHTFQFDGKDAAGTSLPDGSYQIEIAATAPGAKAPTTLDLLTTGTVDGIDLTADPPVLMVGSLRLSLDQVREVRPASGS